MKKYGYINDLQFEWYSSSFLQKLYNSPIVDDGEQIKSSSIYEEDDSVKSEKSKLRNHHKKSNNNVNSIKGNNNIKRFDDIMNNMNEFDLIYNKNIISTKNIKQQRFIDKFNKPECKNIIANSIDNYVNNDMYKRKRLSSY